jgi:hypothetical protein
MRVLSCLCRAMSGFLILVALLAFHEKSAMFLILLLGAAVGWDLADEFRSKS